MAIPAFKKPLGFVTMERQRRRSIPVRRGGRFSGAPHESGGAVRRRFKSDVANEISTFVSTAEETTLVQGFSSSPKDTAAGQFYFINKQLPRRRPNPFAAALSRSTARAAPGSAALLHGGARSPLPSGQVAGGDPEVG